MFIPKPDTEQTRIRLPRRSMPPSKEYLEFAFAQAFQYRDKEVEISWTDYSATKLFVLIVKVERDKTNPYWTLCEENSQGSQFLWSGETSDLEDIEKKIATLDPVAKEIMDTSTGANAVQVHSKPDSPYRKMFSTSYHGIQARPQNSLRDSFTRLRPVFPPFSNTASGNNPPVGSDNTEQKQSLPTAAENQSEAANTATKSTSDALLMKQIIIDGLSSLGVNQGDFAIQAISDTVVAGNLEQTKVQNEHLINLIAASKMVGKLELVNQLDGVGQVFFEDGVAYNASISNIDEQSKEIKGDEALIEMILWSPGTFRFTIEKHVQLCDVSNNLESIIKYALFLRDQLVNLQKAGLKLDSLMIKKQENLEDNELRLLLSKNTDEDPTGIITLYKNLPKRFTVSQLFDSEEGPRSVWVPILFNLYTSGLIEIRPPLAVNESSLDFLGDAKAAIQALKTSLIRQETGVFIYPAFLYFLQHEYLRYQLYDSPLSLIIFEMSKISDTAIGGLDLINRQETLVALRKIAAVKRPLDILAHFETMNYALLLPDTNAEVANQIAKRIVSVLSAQPLSDELDPSLLKLSFGVGNIPQDGGDLEALIIRTKQALQQSKNGDFIVVQANSVK